MLKIIAIVTLFLDKPYHYEPLGEGEDGIYSTLPLYRFDQFDCVTFVDTVLAKYYSHDDASFKHILIKIRYRDGKIDYTRRTDWFIDLEWNPTMHKLGYLHDVTHHIANTETATTFINKPEFFSKKTAANIVIPGLSEKEIQKKCEALRAEGKRFQATQSTLSYIPLSTLLHHKNALNHFPHAAVVELVRPNWRPVNPLDTTQDYGTNLNVAHLGFAVRTPLGIMFYHASSTQKKVVCVPLIDYLKSFEHDTRLAPVAGIHVEEIKG